MDFRKLYLAVLLNVLIFLWQKSCRALMEQNSAWNLSLYDPALLLLHHSLLFAFWKRETGRIGLINSFVTFQTDNTEISINSNYKNISDK